MLKRIRLVLLLAVGWMFVLVLPAYAQGATPPQPLSLTPERLAAIVGAALSLFASYAPKFRTWWAALEADAKMSWMAAANVGFGILIYILACVPALGFPFVACPAGRHLGPGWDHFDHARDQPRQHRHERRRAGRRFCRPSGQQPGPP